MSVKRLYVEKKENAAVERRALLADIRDNLRITGLTDLRVLLRYDVAGLEGPLFERAKTTIFSEPQVDRVFEEDFPHDASDIIFACAFLPGQYDQRADSAAQCVQILTQSDQPQIRTAKVYVLKGSLTQAELDKIKDYLINPVEAQETPLQKPESLELETAPPQPVGRVAGFIDMSRQQLQDLLQSGGFAMDLDDLLLCQDYFKNTEHRNPTETELKMIDTYWSDHCRHTTFSTRLREVEIQDAAVKQAYGAYLAGRDFVYDGKKPKDLCFMDIATLAAKKLKKEGGLQHLDESDEINACSVVEDVVVDGKPEQYLIQFKNETHNHPTEIEPFGGAATCLGGAIRDPLSGRAYVYQAMRVTGAGDPTVPVDQTLPGKLPQRKITQTAAHGYSSYGNQIGLATGLVHEIYDEGYIAKRMEIGAVIGAVPRKNVVRLQPQSGDVVILLGGRTGRDGCGGATGSSKAHTKESLETCGAEVQKGNPPIERKIQRLFRNADVTSMIKRCNDFGAGGVSVAIGELAEGLSIDLNRVPKKYEGLTGTELAISESQERMAVVVSPEDADRFITLANQENLEATVVAEVTEEKRLVMRWNGDVIVNISRAFLDTNGAPKEMAMKIPALENGDDVRVCIPEADSLSNRLLTCLRDLNVASQRGLGERFDSTIGAGSVLAPYGGKYQQTPAQVMAAKVPVLSGNCGTATLMSFGYNPKVARKNPFLSAVYAVVESVTRLVAAGGDMQKIYLTLQEYFEKPFSDPERWGKPLAALLGAYVAQTELGLAAIGGKDSMSGSFNELDVPPTLVSFAVCACPVDNVMSNEFKRAGSQVYLLPARYQENGLPDFAWLKENFRLIHGAMQDGKVLSAYAVGYGGIAEAVCKMSFGNRIGFALQDQALTEDANLFRADYGAILLEVPNGATLSLQNAILLGHTTQEASIVLRQERFAIDDLVREWQAPLDGVFAANAKEPAASVRDYISDKTPPIICKSRVAKPTVFLPVFPGTNCEYDTVRAFEQAGAQADVFVINNLSSQGIIESVAEIEKRIRRAQMIMLAGGFSAGDEPDGSGKFIATFFRNPSIRDATMELLQKRDGLMLGICNGFQALIKLGLVPYGEIRDMDDNCPTLTYNTIGRHISTMVQTKVCSKLSVWLAETQLGEVHQIPVSHGEGRFSADAELIAKLYQNGQIATQYVDFGGNASADPVFNPNCSDGAIEGITSPDGRVFGKMGHSERIGDGLYKNIEGNTDQQLFRAGVKYFA